MKVNFKKLHERATLPKYAKQGDAGMDLFPVSMETVEGNIVCSFGFAIEVPEGHVALIFPRSGIYKHSYTMSNSVGVIDSGYRGEVKAIFKKFQNYAPSFYSFDQAVAQMIVMPYPTIEPEWADTLSETERGTGGFGSTSEIKEGKEFKGQIINHQVLLSAGFDVMIYPSIHTGNPRVAYSMSKNNHSLILKSPLNIKEVSLNNGFCDDKNNEGAYELVGDAFWYELRNRTELEEGELTIYEIEKLLNLIRSIK